MPSTSKTWRIFLRRTVATININSLNLGRAEIAEMICKSATTATSSSREGLAWK